MRLRFLAFCIVFSLCAVLTTRMVLLAQEQNPVYDSSLCIVKGLENLEDERIDCGTLTVPENYADPDGRQIRLPIIVIRAAQSGSNEAPFLFTAGGPGSSSLGLITYFKESEISQNRDVILFEQRGAPEADPALACPELDETVIELFRTADSATDELTQWADAADACFTRLQAEDIDLTQYTTDNIAADIETLRVALGYEQINFFGVSYSTRLALHYARTYPESTRSLVLDSTVPLNVRQYEAHVAGFERALIYLATQCGSQILNCETTLMANFQQAVERLNNDPAEVTIQHPTSGKRITFLITGDDFASGVFQVLYNTSTIELLPFLIDQVAQGNNDVLTPIAQAGADDVMGGEWGLFYAIQCMDEFPFNDADMVALDRNRLPYLPDWHTLVYGADEAVCTALNLPATSDEFHQSVKVDIPALIFSGGYDPITPPEWGELTASQLPQGYFYEFPSESHVVYFEDDCARQMVLQFMADPTTPPADCSDSDSTLNFITSNNILPTNVFYRLNTDLDKTDFLVKLILLFAGVFAFVIQTGIALMSIMRKFSLSLAGTIATLVALLGLAIMAGLVIIVFTTSDLILGFGLPPVGLSITILLLLQILLTLLLVLVVIRNHRDSNRRETLIRVAFIVSTLIFIGSLAMLYLG